MIKAGLILSLFGGNVKRAQLRDGIHILLIGDPGLGKSQMLQACARISTKGKIKFISKNIICKKYKNIKNIFQKSYKKL